MVARLLGFSVVRGDTHCIQDTPPVGVPDSVTITCPYQVKVRALELVFQGPVQSGFLAFFGQDRDRTGLQKFPFWEKTEPDWEKPAYIGPVLNICQL